MVLLLMMVSLRSAKTKAFGIDAPRRLSMRAFGIATTSAVTVRVHCCMTGVAVAGFAGVVVVAAGLAGAASVVSVFAESPSAFGDSVAGFAFASSAGGNSNRHSEGP